jgi:hypothetical protein
MLVLIGFVWIPTNVRISQSSSSSSLCSSLNPPNHLQIPILIIQAEGVTGWWLATTPYPEAKRTGIDFTRKNAFT